MKKLLYSSIILTCFSISLLIFQISCQDEVIAKDNLVQAQNKILYGNTSGEFWTVNADGTNPQLIPIVLPSGLDIYGAHGRLTPDMNTLVFLVRETTSEKTYIYSISLNGSNLKKLVEITVANPSTFEGDYDLLQAY